MLPGYVTHSLNVKLYTKQPNLMNSLTEKRNSQLKGTNMQAWGDPPPPLPDNLPSVVQLRQLHSLPPLQSTIMFLNGTRTMCYANGGTNTILAPVSINEFLGQLPSTVTGLVKRLRLLSLTPPGQVN